MLDGGEPGIPAGCVGYKLKSTSGWQAGGNGDNSSGFNALPAGYRSPAKGNFSGEGIAARFYTSTSAYPNAIYRFLRDFQSGIRRHENAMVWGSSVRCIKGE